MRTVTNYYLLNLAIADASISIFNTGFSWSYNFYYVWIFGPTYCAINNLMGIAPICASVFTMIIMSIDRWIIWHLLFIIFNKKKTFVFFETISVNWKYFLENFIKILHFNFLKWMFVLSVVWIKYNFTRLHLLRFFSFYWYYIFYHMSFIMISKRILFLFRYVAIVYPLKPRLGRRSTVSAIILIWILAILCGLPALLASKQELNYFVDDSNEIFIDPICLADNFPDGNALTSRLFNM